MKMKRMLAAAAAAALALSLAGCGGSAPAVTGSDAHEKYPEAHILRLNGNTASLDGVPLEEFDYVWRAAPDLPEAQFTGTKPDETLGAYIAHDVIYYPEIPESAFTKEDFFYVIEKNNRVDALANQAMDEIREKK